MDLIASSQPAPLLTSRFLSGLFMIGLLLATLFLAACSPAPDRDASAQPISKQTSTAGTRSSTGVPLGDASAYAPTIGGQQLIARILAILPRLDKPSDLTLDLVEDAMRTDLSDIDAPNGYRAKVSEGWEYVVRGTFEGPVRGADFWFLPQHEPYPERTRCTLSMEPVRRSLEALGFRGRIRAPDFRTERMRFTNDVVLVDLAYYRTRNRRPADLNCLENLRIGTSEEVSERIDAALLEARFLELANETTRFDELDRRLVERVMESPLGNFPNDTRLKARGRTTQGWDYWLTFHQTRHDRSARFAIWLNQGADETLEGADQCTLPLASFEHSMRDIGYDSKRGHGIHGGPTPFVYFSDTRRPGVRISAMYYLPDPGRRKDYFCIDNLAIAASAPQ